MKVWLNGRIVNKEDAKITVFDHGTLYGDGVFEGIRVYGGKIFQCMAHVDRLFASADSICLRIPYTRRQIVDAMYETLRANDKQEAYIRLVVTRGEGTLGLSPWLCPEPSVFIIVSKIQLYPEDTYEKGISVIVSSIRRCSANMLDPRVKSLNYLNNIRAKLQCSTAQVAEAIMLNVNGNVCECTSDNIFIVREGRIITPDENQGILMGVTRGVILRLAEQLGIESEQRVVPIDEIFAADECFLTGTAAEVIAVSSVDDRLIGTGKIGPVTRRLLNAFREFAHSDQAEGPMLTE